MITFKQKGDFNNTEKLLKQSLSDEWTRILDHYGREGVDALRHATPKDTGRTADSWTYDIVVKDGTVTIEWYNSHMNKGVNIAILLQYGHATGTGGYVQGLDYINPALRPIFEELAEKAWKEVTSI